MRPRIRRKACIYQGKGMIMGTNEQTSIASSCRRNSNRTQPTHYPKLTVAVAAVLFVSLA